MRRSLLILISLSILFSCGEKKKNTEHVSYEQIITPDYELEKPNTEPQAVLILFGGYPEVATDVKREFRILAMAKEHQIAVIHSNFNQKLWLEEMNVNNLPNNSTKYSLTMGFLLIMSTLVGIQVVESCLY